MTQLNWKHLIQEIQTLATFWPNKRLQCPHLCDYLVAIRTHQHTHLHRRILEAAIDQAQTPYPNLQLYLLQLYQPISDHSYYCEVGKKILLTHLRVPNDFQLDTTLLFLDDPAAPMHYNIIHPQS